MVILITDSLPSKKGYLCMAVPTQTLPCTVCQSVCGPQMLDKWEDANWGLHVQEKDDCTHWCHPSGYQLWIWEFYQVLREQAYAFPPLDRRRAAATSSSL